MAPISHFWRNVYQHSQCAWNLPNFSWNKHRLGRTVCFDFWWCFFSPPLTVLHFFHCYLSTLLESCDLRKECTIKVEKIKQKVDEWKTFFSRLFGKHWPICKLFFFTPVKKKKKSQVSKLQVKIWGNFLESLFSVLSFTHFSLFGKLTSLRTSVTHPDSFSLDGHTTALLYTAPFLKPCWTRALSRIVPLSPPLPPLILHLFPARPLQIVAI